MRICIITFPLHTNYGGILQAFALQHYLRSLGYDAYTNLLPIKNMPRKMMYINYVRDIVYKFILKKKYLGDIQFPYFLSEEQFAIIAEHTNKFVKNNIRTVELFNNKCSATYKFKVEDFDVFVVGSDQIWRPVKNKGINPYYLLDFLKDRAVIRLAYSVSFAILPSQVSKINWRKTQYLVDKFKAISVREDSGKEFCKKYYGKEVEHLLDPTMLLTIDDYKSLWKDFDDKSKESNYLFSYILDDGKYKRKIAERVAQIQNLSIDDTLVVPKVGWKEHLKIDQYKAKPVESWLMGIFNSEFVVTDSFHGCVFSILFNKPFVVVMNKNRGAARFTSLLKLFNLENRLLDNNDDISKLYSVINANINWTNINAILNNERKLAYDFITKNIQK